MTAVNAKAGGKADAAVANQRSLDVEGAGLRPAGGREGGTHVKPDAVS